MAHDDEDVVAQRHLARQAAAVVVLVAAVEAAVGADEGDLDDVIEQAGALERDAAAACRSIRPCRPPRAPRACSGSAGSWPRGRCRRIPASPAACARAARLMSSSDERDRVPHAAGDLDPPVVVGHIGHVEMAEQIVRARSASRRGASVSQQDARVAVGRARLRWRGTDLRRAAAAPVLKNGLVVAIGLLHFGNGPARTSLAETIRLAAATRRQG